MNQHTINQGLEISREWGPMALIAIGFVFILGLCVWGFIIYANNVNRNAVIPTKEQDKQIDTLFDKVRVAEEKIQKIQLDLKDVVSTEAFENRLMPKVDSIFDRLARIEQKIGINKT